MYVILCVLGWAVSSEHVCRPPTPSKHSDGDEERSVKNRKPKTENQPEQKDVFDRNENNDTIECTRHSPMELQW